MNGSQRLTSLAALVALLAAGGCRAIFLSGRQDVTVSAPPGEEILVDGQPAAPGLLRLDRSHNHTISTAWGWSTVVQSRMAPEFICWLLFVSGPFELIDLTNGTQDYLEPDAVSVPPRPAAR